MIPTPTLDKMQKIKERTEACGELLEWLAAEKGVTLCVPHEHRYEDEDNADDPDGCRAGTRHYQCGFTAGQFIPAQLGGIEKILAEFFEIDLAAAEREKLALLDEIRKANAAAAPR